VRLYLEAGLDAATAFIRRAWGERVSTHDKASEHPNQRFRKGRREREKGSRSM
jgi:ribonuclease-3